MSKKEKTGRVVSTKMEKTIVVAVEEYKKHPKYGKYQRWTEKFKAHDEEHTCNEGDLVTIIECAPYSKEKTWDLKAIVDKAAQV